MALHSLYCADVLLRNCSLTQCQCSTWWIFQYCMNWEFCPVLSLCLKMRQKFGILGMLWPHSVTFFVVSCAPCGNHHWLTLVLVNWLVWPWWGRTNENDDCHYLGTCTTLIISSGSWPSSWKESYDQPTRTTKKNLTSYIRENWKAATVLSISMSGRAVTTAL